MLFGVMQKLGKMEKRFQAEKDTYSTLKEKHVACVAAQRNYFSLLKLFQVSSSLTSSIRRISNEYGSPCNLGVFFNLGNNKVG